MRVLKPHNLPHRRLIPGQDVSEQDVRGSLTVEELINIGVLESDLPKPAAKKAAKEIEQ